MSKADDMDHGGIPTRVIHESYVDLVNAMRGYYRADQQGSDVDKQRAHSTLQNDVLSFFEVLRPYLATKDSMQPYWQGEVPDYDGHDGTAILWQQSKRVPVSVEHLRKEAGDDWQQKPMEWLHEQIAAANPELNGNAKIDAVHYESDADALLLKVNQYQVGLHHLDGKYDMEQTVVERGGSFMRHKAQRETMKRKMPVNKLFNAAHALEEAAERMNLLTEIKEERAKYLAGGDTNDHPEPFGDAKKPLD